MSTTNVAPVHPATGQTGSPAPTYVNAIGYLRAFIVVMVVAHHAALAYYPYAPPVAASLVTVPRWWQAFPVVDPHQWGGAPLFVGFNDTFFMSLMFILSGLFVWSSLRRKGGAAFLRDRLLRLGLPFLIMLAVVAPLAYYPTYLQIRGHEGVAGFIRQWLSLGAWPAGPGWFLWVLLSFDCIAALLFALAPKWGEAFGSRMAGLARRPAAACAVLAAISAILYVPLALVFSPLYWSAFGPFTFQTPRILHYLAYFLIGVGVGAWGLDRGLLMPGGKLARRWPLWMVWALVAFLVLATVAIVALSAHAQSQGWAVAYDALFSVSCAASCFAFLAFFVRFAGSRSRVFDSLSRNSYGIFLVHYAFVSWLQYALLPASLDGWVKFPIVFTGAVALSWGSTLAIRGVRAVGRVI
jgi:peptidoglycan/LPS O-acetylase OafA/YrhL